MRLLIVTNLALLVLPSPMAIAEPYNGYYDNLRQNQVNIDRANYMHMWKHEMGYDKGGQVAQLFNAIAYSEATDLFGFSWGKHTQEEAEQEAIKQCGAPDAKVLCRSKGKFCALADGPKTYGAGTGETAAIAEAEAMKVASTRGPGAKIVLLVGNNGKIVKLEDKSFGLDLLNAGPRPRR
jgi:hypothetical protein